MIVVVAPAAFGRTLSAPEAAAAIARGWARVAPGDRLGLLPVSDGGPGFLDALTAGGDLPVVTVTVLDRFGAPVEARILVDGAVAYVETAQASGPPLDPDQAGPDTGTASSWGVGQLLRAAADCGVGEVVLGLGGSAGTGTGDGGAGLLAAVGLALLDGQGAALPPGRSALPALDRVEGVPALRGVGLIVAAEADGSLVDAGAGDGAVAHLALILERDLRGCPAGLAGVPGGAGGGGIGAALLALGARRGSAFDLVAARNGLPAAISEADLVLTGEGLFDHRSLRGRGPAAVSGLALEHGVPCLVLAEQVSVGRREQAAIGVDESYSIAPADPPGTDLAADLADLAASVARTWSH